MTASSIIIGGAEVAQGCFSFRKHFGGEKSDEIFLFLFAQTLHDRPSLTYPEKKVNLPVIIILFLDLS